MAAEAASALRSLLGSADESVEPDSAKLHRLLGEPAPCLAPAQLLCGVSGACAETGCARPRYRYALQPLRPLHGSYSEPRLLEHVAAALQALAGAAPGRGTAFTDYTDWRRGLRCSSALGCRRHASQPEAVLEEGESIRLDALRPWVTLPQLLSRRTLRPRRLDATARWLAVRASPSECLQLICLTGRCRAVLRDEQLSLEEGRAALLRARRCAAARLELDTLLSADPPDSPLYSLAPLIPIWARAENTGRGELGLSLLLWNPLRRPVNAPLIARGYRVLRAEAAYTLAGGLERLSPEYDRVLVPVGALGLVLVRLALRRIPALLRRSPSRP